MGKGHSRGGHQSAVRLTAWPPCEHLRDAHHETSPPKFSASGSVRGRHPGKLNFGAPTAGTLLLAAELFKMMAGVNIVHVAYRGGGGQVVTDLLAGRLQVSFDVMPTVIEYVRAGKLRGVAGTTAARAPARPDVPPVRE